jgi:hypothetical protein
LLFLTAFLAADRRSANAQDKPKQDPEKLFTFADANKDGKLSRAEFRKLLANNAKLKDNPKGIDQLFDYLDTDKDGYLNLAEFKKITSLGQPKDKEKDKPARFNGKETLPDQTLRHSYRLDRGNGESLRDPEFVADVAESLPDLLDELLDEEDQV